MSRRTRRRPLYFPQTHHAVGGAFLKYWTNNGGLTRFGFPVTEETSIKDNTGKQITVQFFERVRMEYHPENAGTQYEVLLGQLGRELAGNRTDQPFQAVPESTKAELNDDGAMYFQETQHTLANGFRLYWQANGGLPIFGYPLSQEFTEKNADDGSSYTVQYFERARFEWHPEVNGGSVLIGLMGKASAQTIHANMSARAAGQPARVDAEHVPEVDRGQPLAADALRAHRQQHRLHDARQHRHRRRTRRRPATTISSRS